VCLMANHALIVVGGAASLNALARILS
jgi:hypothetical protein